MFNGAVLELDRGVARRLGPDILAEAPDYEEMLTRFGRADQQRQVGDALLDQRLVAGIGNLWKAESLWRARVSPWRRLAEVSDDELRATLEEAQRLMRGRLEGVPGRAQVYRRKGRPCPRCGDENPLLAAGRRRPHGLLVPRVPERRGTEDGVSAVVIVRAPQLFDCLRAFCLGSFRALLQELEHGADLPFAFEEHSSYDRPALYEYRPLVKPFIESRAHTLRRRPDAELAVDELRREPAAAIFARAHAGPRADEHEALFGSVLLPLLMSTAEMCGGFDWDDSAYERAYAELEAALFGEGHQYGAVAPLIGITTGGATIELGANMRIRLAATGELAKLWPEANGLLPTDFGREADRLPSRARACPRTGRDRTTRRARRVRRRDQRNPPCDRGARSRRARCSSSDWTGALTEFRPVLPIAATQPAGEPTRLDSFRAALAADLLPRLALADDDPELGEALDRWELSLFQDGPFQAEQLREALAALLGGNDGLWAAAVRGADPPRRHATSTRRAAGPSVGRAGCRRRSSRARRDVASRRPREARRFARRVDPRAAPATCEQHVSGRSRDRLGADARRPRECVVHAAYGGRGAEVLIEGARLLQASCRFVRSSQREQRAARSEQGVRALGERAIFAPPCRGVLVELERLGRACR